MKTPSVDNSLIDTFAKEAAQLVEHWNNLNAEEAQGKFVLRTEGGNKRDPKKAVRLLVDTGRPARPSEMTLLLVEFDENNGLVGHNPTLPAFGQQSINIERIRHILENMEVSILRPS